MSESQGVETLHPEYAKRIDEWQTMRDVLEGERAVKAAGERYLPALAGQRFTPQPGTGKTAYDDYLLRAKFHEATELTLKALVGTILYKDIIIEGPDELITQVKDVSLNDTPIEDFSQEALEEIVGMGRFGILVDMPDDVDPKETRPYWVKYTTEQMTNWRETAANGDTYPTMIVLKEKYEVEVDEFETKTYDQYRVLKLVPHPLVTEAEGGLAYVQRIYQKVIGSDGKEAKDFTVIDEIVPMKMGKPLTFIPFQAFGPTSLSLCPEKPGLLAMAGTNLHMYRRSADLEHGRHFTGLPTPVVIGLADLPPGTQRAPFQIGSAIAWTLPIGADVKYLEFTGQGLGSLEKGIEEDKQELAELGSAMFALEPTTGQETATAVRIRHGSRTAGLKTTARRYVTGVSKLLRMHAWWSGLTQDMKDDTILAKIDTLFIDTKITAEDLKALVLALQAGGIAFATFYAQLEKGELTRPGVDAEQEQTDIQAEAEIASQQAADSAAMMAEAVPPQPVGAGF